MTEVRDRGETTQGYAAPPRPDATLARPRFRASRGATPSCHGDVPGAAAPAGSPVVALVGAPNVGKSTLFNTLTGAKRTVGNWPGTTVEVGRGVWPTTRAAATCDCETCTCPRQAEPVTFTLVDLPGAYSLDPASPDEALTRELLVDVEPDELPDAVVVIADAAHLARSLYIVAQVRELGLPLVVALTMNDVARHRGIEIDTYALAEQIGAPVVAVDPRRRQGESNLAAAVLGVLDAERPAPRAVDLPGHDGSPCGAMCPLADCGLEDLELADERFEWIDGAVHAGTRDTGDARRVRSDLIDRFVTAPVLGPVIFLAVMWLVFQITTTVAAPLQDALDGIFTGPVSDGTRGVLAGVGLGGTPVEGFLVDGLVAGVGMLLTFVPLMALMFLLLALLEDSGYMARAAVVTDRMMRRIGLPGRAFLPLVVGFGCNVPAVAATRILPNARQRVLTALLVPFTSCSARLTVYVLLATTFYPRQAGTVVFAMYLVSILLVVAVGLLLKSTLWRTMGADPLVIDLPPYQLPTARLTLSVMWQRLKGFLRTASGIIVATVCVVWLLQSIPAVSGAGFGEVPVSDSVYAAVAKSIAPLLSPAGFGQWETVSALVVGFIAKEAVISSWAQTYAIAEPASEREPGQLGAQLHQTFEMASGGHTGAALAAFMVFLLAYTPCVATLSAQKREIGLRWTVFGVLLQLVVAWALAVATFQIGRMIW
ncbi:MAG: ferrous iron transport protein B [Micrococcales bacterium]|nr:ferrous iron transport protein B [Micrococcales bacterium]